MNDEDLLTRPPLVAWLCSLLDEWRNHRDQDFKDKWDEYYRLYRGIFDEKDKTRQSERSKLINPALQQQVEMAVAEQEEATFGRGQWFDLDDDIMDQDKMDAMMMRRVLMEDLDCEGVPDAISETYLLGAIYGTGISKCIVEEKREVVPVSEAVRQAIYGDPQEYYRPVVRWVPVPPDEFVIDPVAKTPDDGFGCAHEFVCPRHKIVAKQSAGIYKSGDLGSFQNPFDYYAKGERNIEGEDNVKIIEYAGFVPRSLLQGDKEPDDKWDDELVEALVTIANDSFILKAVENPYLMKDRPFAAYQHDTIPNRFWGRGVCEKGYHPQKALDAELRARIDGLALSVHPMMGVDATRLPRGMDFSITPGRMIPTNGNPNDTFMPFNFGNINPYIFRSSGDLERMIQVGGGMTDTAMPSSMSPRNGTASGMSMMLSSAIKRSKRTMANISRNYLSKVINKSLWRYIQFYPERYPAQDYKFIPRTTMGIMAREYEQAQLTNLLQTSPTGSPAYWMILSMIVQNSSMEKKGEALQIIQQQMQQSLQPQPEKPDPQMVRAQLEGERLKVDAMMREKNLQLKAEELLLKEREVAAKEYEAQKPQQDNTALKLMGDKIKAEMKAEVDVYKANLDAKTKIATESMKHQPEIKIVMPEPKPKNVVVQRGEDGSITGATVDG